MVQKDENRLRMFTVVFGVLNKFKAIWATNLGLKELFDLLKFYIDAITGKRPVADGKTGGITSDKGNLKIDVILSILEVGSPLASLFFGAGNMELNSKVKFSKSDLENLGEDELADKGIEIAKLANENLEKAKKNGITEAQITHLEEVSLKYKSIISTGRETVSIRVASKKSRKQLIREATLMLEEQMDGIIELYHRASPEFWDAYFTGRRIVEYGVRHETAKKKNAKTKKSSKAKGTTEPKVTPVENNDTLKITENQKPIISTNGEASKTEVIS